MEASQTYISEGKYIESIYEILERLSFIASIRGTSGDIRVTPLSTPNMSTLSVLGNMQLVGGYSANNQIPSQMNTVAIQSNINNITIS